MKSTVKSYGSVAMVTGLLAVAGCSPTEHSAIEQETGHIEVKVDEKAKSKANTNYVIHGGEIITMVGKEYVQAQQPKAIWVKDGVIMDVGDKSRLLEAAGKGVEQIDLNGKTLMPGFIEPHNHIPMVIGLSVVTDLSLCLPEPYEYQYFADENAPCPTSLKTTFAALNSSHKREIQSTVAEQPNWIVGNGIDPSRMGNSGKDRAAVKRFIANPAMALAENVDDGNKLPVALVDQSGHVAYVNHKAFFAAGICDAKKPSDNQCGLSNVVVENHCPQNVTSKAGVFCYSADQIGGFEYDSAGIFTGRILEEPNMVPFISAVVEALGVAADSPFTFISEQAGMPILDDFIQRIASTGVTTVVNAGGFKTSEVLLFKHLAKRSLDNPMMRFRSLISTDIVDDKNLIDSRGKDKEDQLAEIAKKLHTDRWDENYQGLYGVYGIKLWSDGSTQGCSAYLTRDYDGDGICEGTAADAGQNYDRDGLYQALEPFWNKDWLIQVHANGDAAMEQTINTFGMLQLYQCKNADKPWTNPLTLHHATVGLADNNSKNIMKIIGDARKVYYGCSDSRGKQFSQQLDITVSHTPAHIAYWGGAFQSILDGKGLPIDKPTADADGRASMIDPTKADLDYGVPFSLHSDVPVSPINPLWYVEQVVNRDTWFYPNLKSEQRKPMPVNDQYKAQNVSVYQALRGITIVPAKQNLLDDKIGTIEAGKVADLVILDDNPLTVDSRAIHAITPCYTFVNGHKHQVFDAKDDNNCARSVGKIK